MVLKRVPKPLARETDVGLMDQSDFLFLRSQLKAGGCNAGALRCAAAFKSSPEPVGVEQNSLCWFFLYSLFFLGGGFP